MAVADGFLSRWSQRKQALRAGKPPADPPAPVASLGPVVHAPAPPGLTGPVVTPPSVDPAAAPPAEPAAPAPALTLDDVKTLTPESDYAPFVAREVAPAVRNAAMKKLFTDPHYNVMDRLDIYIDDYSQPDPLPAAMLRQMASAKFLNLFEDEEKDAQAIPLPAPASEPIQPSLPPEPGTHHDHTDLRLQPNHGAQSQEPGRGTE